MMSPIRNIVLLSTAALVLAGAGLASAWPDGLETVALGLGFSSHASQTVDWIPFAEYEVRWLNSSGAAKTGAAVIGTLMMLAVGGLLSVWVRRDRG